jgi:N-acetylmuramoyl-L-alanine amidase
MVNDPVIKASYAGELNKLLRKDTTDGDKDKEADFYIIKGANCPAVLTENLFQDNRKDVELLESQYGLQVLTELHAIGIEKYVKMMGKK